MKFLIAIVLSAFAFSSTGFAEDLVQLYKTHENQGEQNDCQQIIDQKYRAVESFAAMQKSTVKHIQDGPNVDSFGYPNFPMNSCDRSEVIVQLSDLRVCSISIVISHDPTGRHPAQAGVSGRCQ